MTSEKDQGRDVEYWEVGLTLDGQAAPCMSVILREDPRGWSVRVSPEGWEQNESLRKAVRDVFRTANRALIEKARRAGVFDGSPHRFIDAGPMWIGASGLSEEGARRFARVVIEHLEYLAPEIDMMVKGDRPELLGLRRATRLLEDAHNRINDATNGPFASKESLQKAQDDLAASLNEMLMSIGPANETRH